MDTLFGMESRRNMIILITFKREAGRLGVCIVVLN